MSYFNRNISSKFSPSHHIMEKKIYILHKKGLELLTFENNPEIHKLVREYIQEDILVYDFLYLV